MASSSTYDPPITSISLAIVRVLTACFLGVLGAFIIQDEAGFLGGKNQFTLTGAVLSVAWCLSAALAILGLASKQVWGGPLSCLIIFATVSVFTLAIPEDPLIAGGLVFCLSYLGGCDVCLSSSH